LSVIRILMLHKLNKAELMNRFIIFKQGFVPGYTCQLKLHHQEGV
jgi:hypothetical protein